MKGIQTPSTSVVPKWHENHWQDVVELCEAYDLFLDPWQQNVLKAASGEDAFGRWSATRVGLSVARQQGKSELLVARELAGLLLYGEHLIMHSAHLLPTALEGFERVKAYFENFDDLGKMVKRIRLGNGDQSIEMMSGQRLLFKARALGSGRGFSPSLLILDEAQILGARQWSAIFPAMSAQANPQAWLAGTPPTEDDDAEAFTNIRASALGGRDKRAAWMEWSMAQGDDLDDLNVWAKANPALGERIQVATVEDERNSMSDDQFATERLGYWMSETEMAAIPLHKWDELAIAESEVSSDWKIAGIGLDMNLERTKVTIAIAVFTDTGTHVDLAVDAPFDDAGTTALVDWLWERAGRRIPIVIDGFSPAKSMQPHLVRKKMLVRLLDTRELVQACANFYDDVVTNQSISHPANPLLDASIAGSVKDVMNKAGEWKFNRSDFSVDLGPLVSAVNAHFGALKFARRRSSAPEKVRGAIVF